MQMWRGFVHVEISREHPQCRIVKLFNIFTAPKADNPAPLDPVDISVQYNNSVSPTVTIQTKDDDNFYDLKTEYVRLSTSGDENVCAMCTQFEGKFFLADDAPELPLCPSCACAYEYYYSKEDLPFGAIISNKDDFVLPAGCTPMFYKKQQQIYEVEDMEKCIRLCESQMKKLHEFMEPYVSAGFPAPNELACRDLLPNLYMQLGKWKKAENTIKKCIAANAYCPRDGSDELASLETYQKVATETLSYISQNPGCLQRNIYKAMGYEGNKKEHLKYFLRNSSQIEKVKHSSTLPIVLQGR